MLGEKGLECPWSVMDVVPAIALFCDSSEPSLLERAINALGRIGRDDFVLRIFRNTGIAPEAML